MQQVATPVMQGNSPHLFLDQAAYFEMNPSAISRLEQELLIKEALYRDQRQKEKDAIQAAAIQQAALRQALSSPQAQAMIGNQVGMI